MSPLPNGDDELVAVLLEQFLHALDRVALIIKQDADALEQFDVVGPVVAAPAAALHRFDLGEAGFPEPQDTCCGRSRSSATSDIVRNASGLLSIGPLRSEAQPRRMSGRKGCQIPSDAHHAGQKRHV
jgi:hypothetical protein